MPVDANLFEDRFDEGLLDLFRADHIAKLNFCIHLKLAKVHVLSSATDPLVYLDLTYVKLLGASISFFYFHFPLF